jgi:hypothetical protein
MIVLPLQIDANRDKDKGVAYRDRGNGVKQLTAYLSPPALQQHPHPHPYPYHHLLWMELDPCHFNGI